MTFEVSRAISAYHPSLPGHFPDRPIVPAVVILDEVITAAADWQPAFEVAKIETVKFLAPLKPEEPFTIHFSDDKEPERADFICRTQSRVIVQGRLLLRRRSS